MPNCKSFLVTEAERKHVRRRASLVAGACFLPGQAKDLSVLLIVGEVSETAQLENLGKVLYQARCKWTDQIRTRQAMHA